MPLEGIFGRPEMQHDHHRLLCTSLRHVCIFTPQKQFLSQLFMLYI